MKQKLLNKLWLRVGMIVAIMTTALAGTARAESVTVSYGWETADDATKWTITDAITATSGQGNTGTYAGKISTNKTYVQFKEKVNVTSFSFAFKRTSNNNNYNVYIETSTDGSTWTAVETYPMSGFTNGSYSTKTHTFDGKTQYYVRFYCNNTTAVRYVDDVSITYTTSGGGDTPSPTEGTGTINFSNQSGHTAINDASVTGKDNLNNTWTITTEGTTSFTASSTYYQVGSGSKPATSITFTTTLASELNITAMSAKFGGFSGTAGTVTLKVGDTTVGTGSLNASSDVTVNSTSAATGTVLTVTVTGISKGVKCYYISYTCTSSTDPTCETPTFSLAAGTYTSAQNVTISTETEGATIYYTTDGTDPTTSSTQYSGAINVSSTTTIKAIAAAEDHNNSPVASATYTIVPLEHAGTQADPYTVADAHTAIDANAGVTDVYVSGIVCQASANLYSSKYLSYYISDDGTTTNKLEAYNGLGIGGANFTSVDDIQVGDKVVIYGNLKKYNSTYEFDTDNQLVSIVRPPVISVNSTVDLTCDATSGEIEYEIGNPVVGVSLTATEDADWISNIAVTADKVTFTTTANEGEARTATITLSYEGADDKEVTVTQAAYVAPYEAQDGVFDFVEAAAANYDYGSGVGTSESYIYDDKTWTAGNVTLVTSGRYRWWPNDKTLRFYGEDDNSTKASAMVISVPNGKLITSIEITGGTNFSADCGTYESGSWTGCSQSVTLTYAASSGSVNVKTVTVDYIDAVKPSSITLNSEGYATFASTSPVNLDETADCTAWAITAIEGTSITFTQVEGVVAAGTGLLLKGAEGATITPEYSTNAGSAVTGNLLEAVVTPTDIVADQYYGLSGKTFVKVKAGQVPAGKALLPASALGSNPVKAFTFVFEEDDATAIEMVNGQSSMVNGPIYNLAGQRISKMQKGINIVNGKKIAVK